MSKIPLYTPQYKKHLHVNVSNEEHGLTEGRLREYHVGQDLPSEGLARQSRSAGPAPLRAVLHTITDTFAFNALHQPK